MEDFIGLLIVFAVYFLFGAKSSKKKKEAAKARQERRRAERERQADFHTAFTGPQEPAAPRTAAQPVAKPRQESMLPPRDEGRVTRLTLDGSDAMRADRDAGKRLNCEAKPIHLHDVSNQQMDDAGEGDDPCHRGGVKADALVQDISEETVDAAGAQALLHGVIMSEILTRPAQRRMMHRNGRRM